MPGSGVILLRRSTFAGLIVLAMFGTAGYCAGIIFDGIASLALSVMILALGCATAWRYAWLGAGASVLRITLEDHEGAVAELRNGRVLQLKHLGSRTSRMGAYIAARKKWTTGVFLLPGVLDPQAERQLRIWCKWGRLERICV